MGMHWDHIERVLDNVGGTLVLAPGDDFRYVAGWSPWPDERLTFLLITPGRADLVIPSVNAEEARENLPPSVRILPFSDDEGPGAVLARSLGEMARSGLELFLSDDARFDHAMRVLEVWPGARPPRFASSLLRPMRQVKSAAEQEALRASQAINDRAMAAGLAAMRADMTESQLAAVIRQVYDQEGADREAFIIVAAGPHSALPHHRPGPARLGRGPVLLDIGCFKNGYASDMTRVAHVGRPSAEFQRIHAVVESAVRAGLNAAKPGQTPAAIDRAVRGVVERAGLGERFVHRTGHGIGLSVHESPSIMTGEDSPLPEGVVFSIEPGVYLPGQFGVRLEEVVILTADGPAVLSSQTRDIHVAPDE